MWKTLTAIYDGNSSQQLLIALVVVVVTYLVVIAVRGALVRRLTQWAQQTHHGWDDVLAELVRATHGVFIFALSLLIGLRSLNMPEGTGSVIGRAMVVVLLLQAGRWGSWAIGAWLRHRLTQGVGTSQGETVVNLGVIAFALRTLLWVIVLLMILDNLGVNITALVASLGIGGVAVALAVQNILGDLFASLSIALDKPFVVGDFIVVDSMSGTVLHVGLKTTRVQSLSGEELIFSNADLLKSRIRNYKSMQRRRVVFSFGVTFNTSVTQLRRINEIVAEVIGSHGDKAKLERTHLQSLGDSSLVFEVAWHVMSGDYGLYMDIQQDINLQLIERFAAEGIGFAFPTQTLHIAPLPAAA